MYIDEETDRCDFCGQEGHPGSMMHGTRRVGLHPGKDICQRCAHKMKVTNCSVCGAVVPEHQVNNDFECRICRPTGALSG